ncbi:hypothetical protein SCAR479_09109 [Seiridium cardinale]|uniref:Fungal-specific transcription factor domain-containing protein n=1 Tax=Seiridium cardinale TaxID=138064 RepID=A0ABR2XKN7_9PEZI
MTPSYHGISYTWGDPDSFIVVNVNGRDMLVRKCCDDHCVRTEKVCEYPPPQIPLRERRALENQAQPWDTAPWVAGKIKNEEQPVSLGRKLISGSTDPFNCMPIEMPLGSEALLHYYHQAGKKVELSLNQQGKSPSVDPSFSDVEDQLTRYTSHHNIRRIMLDPHAFRNTLICAGMHFAWNAGDLQSFQPAFLYHKLRTIRLVNNWMVSNDRRLIAFVIKQIVTLCFAELCVGELHTAEIHLQGVIAILDLKRSVLDYPFKKDSLEQELADRYFILMCTIFLSFKSRVNDLLHEDHPHQEDVAATIEETTKAMQRWRRMENNAGISAKLLALHLLPYFFNPLPVGAVLGEVDAEDTIACLRELTNKLHQVRHGQRGDTTNGVSNVVWDDGMAARLLEIYVVAHARSISLSGEKSQAPGHRRPATTWCGVFIAAGFYLTHVIDLWAPVECRIHQYMVSLLERDLAYNVECLGRGDPEPGDLLFWQIFLGAFSIYEYQLDSPTADSFLKPSFFCNAIKRWSQSTGTREWSDAEAILRKVAWPAAFRKGENARALWEMAITS